MKIKLLLASFAFIPFLFSNEELIIPEAPEPILEIKEDEKIEIPEELRRIAQCESGSRQFNEDGTVLRGRQNKHDIGRWQINELYHSEKANELGFDIYTEEGNLKFALWLYEKYKTKPWNWSRACWSRTEHSVGVEM